MTAFTDTSDPELLYSHTVAVYSWSIANNFVIGFYCRCLEILCQIAFSTVCLRILYTPVKSYVVKQPQEKWACDFHDDAPPLSFQLQVTEDFF